MIKQSQGWRHYILALVFIGAILSTALFSRDLWPEILGTYAVSFAVYVLILTRTNLHQHHWRYWVAIGVLARIAMLFCFPNLSDDIYRFFWDGQIALSGFNPYDIVPSEFIPGSASGPLQGVFPMLNSPDYYTIYPPVGQGLFVLAAWLAGAHWITFATVLKIFLLSAEGITLWLMYRMLAPDRRFMPLLIYAINPLVILELVGNLHLEVLVITGLMLVVYFLRSSRIAGIALGFTLGIGAKLIPAMLVPLLLRRLSFKRFVWLAVMITGLCGLVFIPMFLSDVMEGAGSSLNLYFQKFEFNASFYYIGRWIGFRAEGYNLIATIGPLLAGLTVAFLAGLIFFEKDPKPSNFPRAAVLALTAYFLLATTVHPWYICTILALSVFTNYRFPVVWSGLVFLSYSAYRTSSYEEDLWLVAVEYILLFGWMTWELLKKRQV